MACYWLVTLAEITEDRLVPSRLLYCGLQLKSAELTDLRCHFQQGTE